jgi:hypothetical protein
MGNSGSGQPLMDVVVRFFQEEQWYYQKLDNKPVIRAGYRGERGTWVCYARVDEENLRIVFYSLMGLNIPSEYNSQVSEYLTRVNYILPVGNFEMNLETGEVRFRTSLDAPDGTVTLPQVRSLVYANVKAMDYYFPGVVAVIHSGLSPEAALARVERQMLEDIINR